MNGWMDGNLKQQMPERSILKENYHSKKQKTLFKNLYEKLNSLKKTVNFSVLVSFLLPWQNALMKIT